MYFANPRERYNLSEIVAKIRINIFFLSYSSRTFFTATYIINAINVSIKYSTQYTPLL